MARPHIPVAVRRTVDGGKCEVQTKGGSWLPMSLVGEPTMRALYRDVCQGRPIPDYEAFEFRNTDAVYDTDNVEPWMTDSAPSPDDTDDTERDTERPEQPTDNGPDDKDNDMPDNDNSAPPTIESLVRQIAGSMDSEAAAKLVQLMDEKLAAFTPPVTNSNERLTPVLTNVTIHRPEMAPLPVDGLFHMAFPKLLRAVAVGQHMYLPGSPGTGKSHAGQQVAQVLGYKFNSTSFGPTTPESRLTGGMTADGTFFEPAFLEGVRHAMNHPDSGYIHLFDEMDNAHPGVVATLNSILANGWMTAPNGDHLTVGSNFVVIAAANTFGTGPTAEFAGKNKLDPATLDRFGYLPWEIDAGMEEVLVRQRIADTTVADTWLDVWRTTRKNVADHGLKLFITPRGAVNGAKLIAGGFDIDEAYMIVLGNKVPADQFAKINAI